MKRSIRVAGLLKTEIGRIIQTQIKDPLIGFVTITDVVLSDDLKIAKVYFSTLGDAKQQEKSLKGLERARTYIQNELASRVRLRYLPVLRFYADTSWDYGSKIDRLIDDLHTDDVAKNG